MDATSDAAHRTRCFKNPRRILQDDQKSRKDELALRNEIRELFRLFDTNNDRPICSQELGNAMRFLGMTLTRLQVTDAMRTLDVYGSGRKEFREFHTFVQKEMAEVKALTDKELDVMMRQTDIDGDCKINYAECVKIWCEAT
ncbi:hypothetical protein DPMN_069377 [Dreissena polymorpha]|uniref:EF-hand domain-containing protein n=1 Tax=Dreissena polymorpha TaxID=45954 RepID=A0A9D3Z3F3_DREPO|nr:hypothetical protein DPMN_069377 [Dreissena polymorpha]